MKSSHVDIASLNKENDELKKSLKAARELINVAPAFFGYLSLEGFVLDLNDLALQVIESSREQVIDVLFWECPWWKPLSNSARQIHKAVLDGAKGNPSQFDIEYWAIINGVGQKRWVAISISPFRNEFNAVSKVAVSGIDITDRKEAQEAFRLAQERLTRAVLVSKVGFFDWDMANNAINYSEQMKEDWGITATTPRRDPISWIHPEDRERTIGLIRKTIVDGTHYHAQYRVLRPDGRTVWIEAQGEVSRDPDGKPILFIGTSIDITERKNIEEALKQAVNARDTFLGAASHELKTPLTSLKLQSQLAKRIIETSGAESLSPERVARLVYNTATQTDRLSRLVNDMLEVSRISSGKFLMNFEKTDLSTLLRDTVSRFSLNLEIAGCEIELNIENQISANIDTFRFEQVLANLVTNATKYAAGKPVEISLRKKSGNAVLKLRDHGPGIPRDKLDSVFDRFERLPSSSEIGGLGLGLNISREIVKAHGGEIHVESEFGNGSEFVITLPFSKDAAI